MAARMFKEMVDVKSLSKTLSHQELKGKGGNDWVRFLAGLSERSIKWRLPWLENKPDIQHCGSFPNVPLIGVRYCVNYNPLLVQRQFGHSLRGAPSSDYLATLFIYYEDGHFIELLRKVKSAWENMVRAEKDLRDGVVDSRVIYHTWILERVKVVKLPFKLIKDQSASEGPSQASESEELQQLKAEMEKLKVRNARLENELQRARNDLVDMRNDNEEKSCAYENIVKSQKAERDYTFRVKQDLAAASRELSMRVNEKNVALEKGRQWKQLYEEAKRDKREALKRLREAQVQVQESGHQMKEMAT
ncbi:hypothetical protein LR48_Vigan10g229000 [Vigna angularis]|uniref:DUF7745 domain-containing protein n=2 Tax=Phaseolus angularis TaxID=3914 RepID=A0A0L9VN57_PHAAN|nr:hypothetical protein LR48_Vigan10g229000 [Vigna angularis]